MTNTNKNDVAPSSAQRKRKQPHNVYNIFFYLERQLLVQEMERLSGVAAADKNLQPSHDLVDVDDLLSLPEIAPRYRNLHLPQGWWVPRKDTKQKRKHVKTHGGELLLFAFA
jgi:hypothetical protein